MKELRTLQQILKNRIEFLKGEEVTTHNLIRLNEVTAMAIELNKIIIKELKNDVKIIKDNM
jgi:hypothetical protein